MYQFYDRVMNNFTFLDIPEEGFMFTENIRLVEQVYRRYDNVNQIGIRAQNVLDHIIATQNNRIIIVQRPLIRFV